MRPLLTDVELDLSNIASGLRTILVNLAPLLDNGTIHSLMRFSLRALPTVREHFGEKLANLKHLKLWQDKGMEEFQQATVNFLMDWLPSTASDGPKLFECEFRGHLLELSEQIYKKIREVFNSVFYSNIKRKFQQFLAAKTTSTFAIIFHNMNSGRWEFADFQLENGIGEEMHGVGKDGVSAYEDLFQITRHTANCGPQLQEWIKENMDKKKHPNQQIQFWYPTIG